MPNEYRLNTLEVLLVGTRPRIRKLGRRIWLVTTNLGVDATSADVMSLGLTRRRENARIHAHAAFRTRRIGQPSGFRTKLSAVSGFSDNWMSERSIAVGFRNRGAAVYKAGDAVWKVPRGKTRANRSFPSKEEKTVEVNFLLKGGGRRRRRRRETNYFPSAKSHREFLRVRATRRVFSWERFSASRWLLVRLIRFGDSRLIALFQSADEFHSWIEWPKIMENELLSFSLKKIFLSNLIWIFRSLVRFVGFSVEIGFLTAVDV